jgi:hypothetical protein
MLLIGCGERRDARTPDLRKDTVVVGLRLQVACQDFGSAMQALGADMVRLTSYPNVRPDPGVSVQFIILFTGKPDAETLQQIHRQGIQAFSLIRFASILKLQQDCS